ncbi:hypothetical protein Ancab_031977 [Ancistrocladus abbreviatus]
MDKMSQGVNAVGRLPESCEKTTASPSPKGNRAGSGHNPIDVRCLEKLGLSPKADNKPKNEKRRKSDLGPIVIDDKADYRRRNWTHRFRPLSSKLSSKLSKRTRKGESRSGMGPRYCKRKSVGRIKVRESNIKIDVVDQTDLAVEREESISSFSKKNNSAEGISDLLAKWKVQWFVKSVARIDKLLDKEGYPLRFVKKCCGHQGCMVARRRHTGRMQSVFAEVQGAKGNVLCLQGMRELRGVGRATSILRNWLWNRVIINNHGDTNRATEMLERCCGGLQAVAFRHNEVLIVKYCEFDEEYDERFQAREFSAFEDIDSFGERFRLLLRQIQDSECRNVKEGMVVCAFADSGDDRRFNYAIVDAESLFFFTIIVSDYSERATVAARFF